MPIILTGSTANGALADRIETVSETCGGALPRPPHMLGLEINAVGTPRRPTRVRLELLGLSEDGPVDLHTELPHEVRLLVPPAPPEESVRCVPVRVTEALTTPVGAETPPNEPRGPRVRGLEGRRLPRVAEMALRIGAIRPPSILLAKEKVRIPRAI